MLSALWAAAGLAVLLGRTARAADSWHMEWPTTTYQCQTVNVTVTGGTSPWTVGIVPIGGKPFVWTLNSLGTPVNDTNPYTWSIPLQLEAGTPYVAMIADANRYNTAYNPTRLQIVQNSSNTACFASAAPQHQDFPFQISGSAEQCTNNLAMSWNDVVGEGPYSCTIVPLDSSYNPWDVQLKGGGTTLGETTWRVNMTVGTRFTVVMSDGFGFGRGGVGGIYQVIDGPSQSCVTQQWLGTAVWPYQVTATSIPASPTPWSATITSSVPTTSAEPTASGTAGNGTNTNAADSASSSSSSSSHLGSGAIAGIAVGVAVVAIAAIGAGVFFCLRKRRRDRKDATPVDLVGAGVGPGYDGRGDAEPKVEPYRALSSATPVTMGYGSPAMSNPDSPYTPYERSEPQLSPPVGYADYHDHAAGSSTSASSPPMPATNEKSGPFPGAAAAAAYTPRRDSAMTPTSPSTGSAPGGQERKLPLPPGAAVALASLSGHSTDGHEQQQEESVEYRRHTDGGLAQQREGQEAERRVVDLPPLYDDVPRRGDTVRQGEAGSSGRDQ